MSAAGHRGQAHNQIILTGQGKHYEGETLKRSGRRRKAVNSAVWGQGCGLSFELDASTLNMGGPGAIPCTPLPDLR